MFGSDNDNAILRGEAARLSGIRTALSSSAGSPLLDAALEPFLRQGDNDDNDGGSTSNNLLLYQEPHVVLSWQMEDEEEDDNQQPNQSSPSCRGYLVVTRYACLFCALPAATQEDKTTEYAKQDWYVPATSITLHALTGKVINHAK